MSVRARLTLCAWAATLAAATALLPLVDGFSWLLQAAAVLGVQGALGTALRRVPAPRWSIILAQAVLALLMLTFLFVRESAVAGFLPGPSAFEHFGTLLVQGGDDVSQYAIPAPVTDGIRLMLVGGVLLVGLLVDVLAVSYRAAAPAGLPLLALYSVAAGLSGDGDGRWLWFLCAAGGYLVLLLAEGRERLTRWGTVFGEPPPPGAPGATARVRRASPVRTGHRIGVAALGLALLVPLTLPALGTGLLDSDGRGTGGRSDGGNTVTAVNPLVALQDSLNQPENRTVLTYQTDAEDVSDLYLRIVALDEFDGEAWRPSQRRITDVPQTLPAPPGLSPAVDREVVTTRIAAADWYEQSWLPMPYPARRVAVDGRWRFEPEGRTLVGDGGQTTADARYEVQSLAVRPTAEQLANAPRPPEGLLSEYTEVPDDLPGVVLERALAVTAGADNDYERAVALQDWFARGGGFTYDTEVTAGTGSEAIVRFLEQKEGFCIHFSFSMAAMARSLGIPARVAVGFTPGVTAPDGSRLVGLQDAHAWPELYFEGVGWTRFEPTPARGTTPEYAVPSLPEPGATDEPDLPRPEESDEPSPGPEAQEDCPPGLGGCEEEQGAAGASDGFPWDTVRFVALVAALALVVGALLLSPLLWRASVRRRRSGGDALASWQELLDAGWDVGIPPDESATPRQSAVRLVRVGRLDGPAEAAVHRLADAVERALYAPVPGDVPAGGHTADVELARAGLRAAAPRRTRLRATLLPRSTVRVVWAGSERWAALTEAHRAFWSRTAGSLRALLQRG
ncbi:transglutaminase TgpA family protein [Streptomyces chumphonensis]|uniref:transglutaminase TgpA family protein n=1 Tax=Streptomyces chumphonensis TaxID=1214925 RepID=UPI003D734895